MLITLLSDHLSIDLNHKYGEILSTYEGIISEYQITNIELTHKLGQEMVLLLGGGSHLPKMLMVELHVIFGEM
jgi:hypothetical protein